MTLGDALTIGLVLLALWVFVVERYTTLRLEDGVRLGVDAVRAGWERVAPLVRWVAYDVIVGRPSVKDEAEPAPDVLSSSREQQYDAPVLGTGIKAVSIPPGAPDRDIVRELAALKTPDGWRFSANAIYTFVKGNRNDVLAWVREARGLEDDEPEPARLPEQPHIQVPAYEPPPR